MKSILSVFFMLIFIWLIINGEDYREERRLKQVQIDSIQQSTKDTIIVNQIKYIKFIKND